MRDKGKEKDHGEYTPTTWPIYTGQAAAPVPSPESPRDNIEITEEEWGAVPTFLEGEPILQSAGFINKNITPGYGRCLDRGSDLVHQSVKTDDGAAQGCTASRTRQILDSIVELCATSFVAGLTNLVESPSSLLDLFVGIGEVLTSGATSAGGALSAIGGSVEQWSDWAKFPALGAQMVNGGADLLKMAISIWTTTTALTGSQASNNPAERHNADSRLATCLVDVVRMSASVSGKICNVVNFLQESVHLQVYGNTLSGVLNVIIAVQAAMQSFEAYRRVTKLEAPSLVDGSRLDQARQYALKNNIRKTRRQAWGAIGAAVQMTGAALALATQAMSGALGVAVPVLATAAATPVVAAAPMVLVVVGAAFALALAAEKLIRWNYHHECGHDYKAELNHHVQSVIVGLESKKDFEQAAQIVKELCLDVSQLVSLPERKRTGNAVQLLTDAMKSW